MPAPPTRSETSGAHGVAVALTGLAEEERRQAPSDTRRGSFRLVMIRSPCMCVNRKSDEVGNDGQSSYCYPQFKSSTTQVVVIDCIRLKEFLAKTDGKGHALSF